MATKFDLSLIISAVDKVTAPMRAINQRMADITKPVRKLNNSLVALSAEAGIPRLMKGFAGVGHGVARVGHEASALGFKLAALAGGAAFAFWHIAKSSAEAGDDLGMMAERVGMSVDAFAQLRYAANQADVEQEQFNASMGYFAKSLGQAKAGTGPLLQFLNKVSPALAQQVKGAGSTEQALGLMTAAFEKVKDPSKRAALAAAAFGRNGLQMGVFLHQGSKAIDEQKRKFLELAGSQEEFAKRADEFAHQGLFNLEVAFGGLRNRIMGALFPALTKLAQALTAFVSKHGDRLVAWAERAGAALTAWVDGGGVQRVADWMEKWGARIEGVVEKLGGLKGALAAVGIAMALPTLSAVASLAGSLVSLGATVGTLAIRLGMALAPALSSLGASIAAINFAPLIAGLTSATAAVGAFAIAAGPFILAAGGVAAAGYQIWKHWSELPELFTTVTGALNGLKTNYQMLFNPGQALINAGEMWAKDLGFGKPGGPPVTAAGTPGAPGAGGAATVKIEIPNLPKGARVTTDPRSTVPVSLDLGYSMQPG